MTMKGLAAEAGYWLGELGQGIATVLMVTLLVICVAAWLA